MVSEEQKVKFAVIGCGHIGKRHAKIIQEQEESELVALVDTKDKSQLGLDHFNVPFFQGIDALLESGLEIEVINICSPNGLHAEHALKVLSAGKHVVVEKPLALQKSDAEKIIRKAIAVQRQLFVVMQNRYSPPAIWIKNLVDSGKLGKIYLVQLNCYWNRDDRYYRPESWHGKKDLDGGPLFTQFSHFIDILYWLFGDIENIQAKFNNFSHQHSTDFEDSGLVSFDFVAGGMGCINYSTAVWQQNMESSMTIIAENGSVKIGGQYMNEVVYCHIKDYEMPALALHTSGNNFGAYKEPVQNHYYVIENVVNVLKGQNSHVTNALEALKVVDIIGRVYDCRKIDNVN